MRLTSILFLLLSMGRATILYGGNPLEEWVKRYKMDYRARKSINDFHLIGYTYGDPGLTPPPLCRGNQTLSKSFLEEFNKPTNEFVAHAEDKEVNVKFNVATISTFFQLAGKNVGKDKLKLLQTEFDSAKIKDLYMEKAGVFEIIISSRDIDQGLNDAKCKRQIEDSRNWIISQALGISSVNYSFLDANGKTITASAKIRQIMSDVGIATSGAEIETIAYDKPVYVGYVPAHYCRKKDAFRQDCKK